MNLKPKTIFISIFVLIVLSFQNIQSQDVLSPKDLLEIKTCRSIELSPDGSQILYAISTPRGPNAAQGGSYSYWWKMTLKDKTAIPLFPPTGVWLSSPPGISPAQFPGGQDAPSHHTPRQKCSCR